MKGWEFMTDKNWDDCAILVNSCDAYSDLWKPFFRILWDKWPESHDKMIYLNTESKQFIDEGFNIKTLNLLPGKSEDTSWGERLLDAVNRVESKYILMLLEDFFLESKVDNEKVEEAMEIIKKNEKIASICFMTTLEMKEANIRETPEYKNYMMREKKVHYTLNASPTLWRKETLKTYTLKNDNPWVWERFGSIRTWYSSDLFLAKKVNCSEVFVYDAKRGGAVHRGKWVGCCVRPILKELKMDIDLNKRGVVEDWTLNPVVYQKKSLKRMFINKYLSISNTIRGIFMGCRQ